LLFPLSAYAPRYIYCHGEIGTSETSVHTRLHCITSPKFFPRGSLVAQRATNTDNAARHLLVYKAAEWPRVVLCARYGIFYPTKFQPVWLAEVVVTSEVQLTIKSRRTACLMLNPCVLYITEPHVRVGVGNDPQLWHTWSRNCRCCAPDDLVLSSVWIAFICFVFQTSAQIIVTWN
jgi:hypothetical protein